MIKVLTTRLIEEESHPLLFESEHFLLDRGADREKVRRALSIIGVERVGSRTYWTIDVTKGVEVEAALYCLAVFVEDIAGRFAAGPGSSITADIAAEEGGCPRHERSALKVLDRLLEEAGDYGLFLWNGEGTTKGEPLPESLR